MRECHVVLVDLLKPAIASLGDVLFARGLIPLDMKDSVQETSRPSAAARLVVSCLTTQVKYNPSVYHKFVSILREQGQWTELIVERLSSCYESLTACPKSPSASLKSSESLNRLQLEFTLPQDVPQELLTVLESVQISVRVEDQVSYFRKL